MADSYLKDHSLRETQRKTQRPSARPKPKAVSRVPFLIQSAVPGELQLAAEWSSRQLSFSPTHCQASGFLLKTCMWGLHHHWPNGFKGQKVPQTHWPVHLRAGREPHPSFPSVYIRFLVWAAPDSFSAQTSALQEGPSPSQSLLFPLLT